MQTFLIVSSNNSFIESAVEKIKKKYRIENTWLTELMTKPSIGIEEIREIQHKLILKPTNNANQLIFIRQMEKATFQAQNALLKILEEPPPSTYFVLTAPNADLILPTVVSRCQLIRDTSINQKGEQEKTEDLVYKICAASPGQRLQLVLLHAKTKEEAVEVLEIFLSFFHNLLKKRGLTTGKKCFFSEKEIVTVLKRAEQARIYLDKNVNFRAVIDIFSLGLPLKTLDKQ